MQTLGLASEQKPTDGLLKRLFWPTIENEFDVDLLRQQGFWLCVAVATLTAVQLVFLGSPAWTFVIPFIYLLAGVGIREGSVGAAVIIFLSFLSDKVVSFESAPAGIGNPLFGFFILALLLSNIRGTILARRWQRERGPGDEGSAVERSNDSLKDKVVNTMPAAVWPKAQYVFFPLGCALLLFTILLVVSLPSAQRRRAADLRHQQKLQQERNGGTRVNNIPVEPPS